MPFFFFVSGMLTNWRKDTKVFVKAKTCVLLKPFIIYSIVNFIAFSLVNCDLQLERAEDYLMRILKNGWG